MNSNANHLNKGKFMRKSMKFPLISIVGLLAAMLISTPSNAGDGVLLGVVTGTKYRSMSTEQRELWFVGSLDGIMAESFGVSGVLLRSEMLAESPDYYNHRSYDSWLGDCLSKFDVKQVQAIFENHLDSKPETWHAPAALIEREALVGFCRPVLRPDIKGFAKP